MPLSVPSHAPSQCTQAGQPCSGRTALQHDALRLVDLHRASQHALEQAQEGAVVRAGVQGHIEAAEATPLLTDVLKGSSAWEEVAAVHVKADRHDPAARAGEGSL